MDEYANGSAINATKRHDLITAFPCFANFSKPQLTEFISLLHEVRFKSQEIIVAENDIVDSVYILVSGNAEVRVEVKKRRKMVQVPVASLTGGEGIGLNDTGFYSSTGKRTATVIALNDIVALKLELKDLHDFLRRNHLESEMYNASTQMLRMRFIKQTLPFAKISYDRLRWLADHVEEESVAKDAVIFNQGEVGEKCYLIRSGQVEIVSKDESGNEKRLAVLKPPVLFGEATLITRSPRNATARALEATELLTLRQEYLSELIESEDNVAKIFMNLMVDRSRPQKNPNVSVHHRQAADGEELTILKNHDNGSYFKLSNEGAFIWEQLDGKHTLQEITLGLAEKHNVFAPDVVAALISKLTKSKYIENIDLQDDQLRFQSFFGRAWGVIKGLLEIRFAFGDSDAMLSRIYNKYIWYLFTKPAQIVLAFIAIIGFISFIANTEVVLNLFHTKHLSLLLLLGLIPLSLLEVILHELGHAFSVKAFGREVHYIGVGWYWAAPIAFTDTSDMWLATRKPRMIVNFAGIYVDILVAGIASFLIFFIHDPYIYGMLWLFALYTYIGGIRMLNPLQELDGYYVLMDWVDKNRLRQNAVLWLAKDFPKAIREPALFRGHRAEIIYWIACILYILLLSVITLAVQDFVLDVFGIKPSNPYLSLALPVIVAMVAFIGVFSEVRKIED